jgi:hypothetical protein
VLFSAAGARGLDDESWNCRKGLEAARMINFSEDSSRSTRSWPWRLHNRIRDCGPELVGLISCMAELITVATKIRALYLKFSQGTVI